MAIIPLKSLVGKAIISISVNSNKTALLLETLDKDYYDTEGVYMLVASAECCSESWFEHISNIDAYGRINKVETIVIDEDAPGTRQDKDEIYSLKFTTDKGTMEVEMRNSSNGFYGGSIELYQLPAINLRFKPLKKDY